MFIILIFGIFTPGRHTSSVPGFLYSFPGFSHPADTLPRIPGSYTQFWDFHTRQTHFLTSRVPILISGIFTPGRHTSSLPGLQYLFPGFLHSTDTLPRFPCSYTHFQDFHTRSFILASGHSSLVFAEGTRSNKTPILYNLAFTCCPWSSVGTGSEASIVFNESFSLFCGHKTLNRNIY